MGQSISSCLSSKGVSEGLRGLVEMVQQSSRLGVQDNDDTFSSDRRG